MKERVGQVNRIAYKHILPYATLVVNGNVLYDAGSSNLVLCDNIEGWDGVGGEKERGISLQDRDIHITMADSC